MDIQIVPITEDHVGGYHACLDIVARERRYLGLIEAPALAASRQWIASNIAKNAPYYVALHSGNVIGWCDIEPFDRPGFTHRGRLGMGVHPAYRGQGIGARLLIAALHKARQVGLERVELEVFASNTRARQLYEKYGFVVEGHQKEARKLDGVYDDLIEMVLFLTQWKETV
jgi:RimJ/RimL family protein N-acetyltransferase